MHLNAVDNLETLQQYIRDGHWNLVIAQIQHLALPHEFAYSIFEQIVLELIDMQQHDTARKVLQEAPTLVALREHEPERHASLMNLAARPNFEQHDVYEGGTKDSRREALAQSIGDHVIVLPPSRLLSLVGQALKWQQHQGLIPEGKFDLLHGSTSRRLVESEACITSPGPTISFGKSSHAACACFSPDGQWLASGSSDGFVEVWDFENGKLRIDLDYQKEDRLMMHDSSVHALCFSRDSELLASGSQDGILKVWRIRSGQLIRRYSQSHSQGISTIAFSRCSSNIASGSYDNTVRIHGIKSGHLLKEMRGHEDRVNCVCWNPNDERLASCSNDGTIRIWDARTGDCLQSFPFQQDAAANVSVIFVAYLPGHANHLLVCSRSPTLQVRTTSGTFVRAITPGHSVGKDKGHLLACCVSAQGNFAHCVADDGSMYSYDLREGHLEHELKAHDKPTLGVCIHPYRNIVATLSLDNTIRLWRGN